MDEVITVACGSGRATCKTPTHPLTRPTSGWRCSLGLTAKANVGGTGDEAITVAREAVAATPTGHLDRPACLLQPRWAPWQNGRAQRVASSPIWTRPSASFARRWPRFPTDHPARAMYLSGLGIAAEPSCVPV